MRPHAPTGLLYLGARHHRDARLPGGPRPALRRPATPTATLAHLVDHGVAGAARHRPRARASSSPRHWSPLWFYRLFRIGRRVRRRARSPRSAWSTPSRSSAARPSSPPRSTSPRPLTRCRRRRAGDRAADVRRERPPVGRRCRVLRTVAHPDGVAARCAQRLDARPLGWLLIVGGVGYVLSAFVGYLVPDADVVASVLVLPATAGELWMVGYLLIFGVSRRSQALPGASTPHPATSAVLSAT